MGNTQPRLKLHYVKEQDRIITGLVQILDIEKGTAINEVDVYVVGREKISYVSVQNLITLREDNTFFKEKVTIKTTDNEPTFSIKIPDDLPNSGHGGNYGKGVGYAIGYHVYVEAKGNTDISDLEPVAVALGKVPPSDGVDKGHVKLGKRTLEYEIPSGMPRGTTQTLKFKLSDGENQRVRVRVREIGHQLKGQEQTNHEIKYELEDEAISGSEWCTIEVLISKYSNAEFLGKVLKISHLLEMTAIGTNDADYCKIPISFH